jgi:hypothetical protein
LHPPEPRALLARPIAFDRLVRRLVCEAPAA